MTDTRVLMDPPAVLEADGVTVVFDGRNSDGHKVKIRACNSVNLTLGRGQIVALVGESGSGKTTLARALALINRVEEGEIRLNGTPVHDKSTRHRDYYGNVQLIFQDPFASLNSLKPIRHILGRTLAIHGKAKGRKQIETKTLELLEMVNLTPAEDYIDRFPGSLSGGQRQRISIARSLAVEPDVLLADEPTSMLDVSIRLDILNLLDTLRRERGVAVLYITHDIASARYVSDRMQVMYSGDMVETGPTEDIISTPRHPYTQLLLSSAPDPSRRKGLEDADTSETGDIGEPADPAADIPGCRFNPRCPYAMERCVSTKPPAFTVGDQKVACWLYSPDEKASTNTEENAQENTQPKVITQGESL